MAKAYIKGYVNGKLVRTYGGNKTECRDWFNSFDDYSNLIEFVHSSLEEPMITAELYIKNGKEKSGRCILNAAYSRHLERLVVWPAISRINIYSLISSIEKK